MALDRGGAFQPQAPHEPPAYHENKRPWPGPGVDHRVCTRTIGMISRYARDPPSGVERMQSSALGEDAKKPGALGNYGVAEDFLLFALGSARSGYSGERTWYIRLYSRLLESWWMRSNTFSLQLDHTLVLKARIKSTLAYSLDHQKYRHDEIPHSRRYTSL